MDFNDKYYNSKDTNLTWPLKLLYFIGGTIATVFLIGFFALIFVLGDIDNYEPPCFVGGLCLMIGAIVITRSDNDGKHTIAFAYPLYLTGQILLNFGMACGLRHSDSITPVLITDVILLILSWIFCQNHFMRQFFLLAIFVLFPFIPISGFFEDHDYFIYRIFFYYSVFLLVVYEYADRFSKSNLYVQYVPTIRFCSLATSVGYVNYTIEDTWREFSEIKMSPMFRAGDIVESIICATFSFVVAYILLTKYMKGENNKRYVYIGMALLACVASCATPYTSFALLGLILTYKALDRFGVVAYGLSMIYAIFKFYYDLDMLLIHKSYLLMGCGIVFLSLFFLLKKVNK